MIGGLLFFFAFKSTLIVKLVIHNISASASRESCWISIRVFIITREKKKKDQEQNKEKEQNWERGNYLHK